MAAEGIRGAWELPRFDEETDVLVVGLGAAGAAAAIDARAAGARVAVLERASGGGGTSALSGGVIYLGGGTPLQKACGFEDDPEAMRRYLEASCGDGPDEEKLRVYCERSVEHYHWLLQQGVPFEPVFHFGQSGEPPNTDGLVWSGSERAWPFCELARPAPRGHVPAAEGAAGHLLMRKLLEAVQASGATVQGDHRATALLVDREGAVVGAVAEHFGAERAIRARGGVVLATGGFIRDPEMMQAHLPRVSRCKVRVGAEGDDGSGIRLGQAAGGAVLHMEAGSVSLPVTQPWSLKRGVLVNGQGQRFVNEDVYYGRLGEYALLRHDGVAFLVLDDATFERPTYPREVAAVGETPAELERELGLPAGSLEATLALYNRHARAGRDPVFHKAAESVVPLERPPFGALDCRVESSLYAAFTLGGLHTGVDGEVRTPHGGVVPGLFAAGRASCGVSVGGYSSGLSLGDGTLFGRLAGTRAARAASGS